MENTRSFVSVDQVRTWCGTPGNTITVRPVLDLNEHLSGTAYETPDRLVEAGGVNPTKTTELAGRRYLRFDEREEIMRLQASG